MAKLAEIEMYITSGMADSTPKGAKATAKTIAKLSKLRPAALTVYQGSAHLYFELPKTLFQRVFSPGTRSYRTLEIEDVDGAFSKRWQAGMKVPFVYSAPGVAAENRTPYYGQVRITYNEARSKGSNPLEYLDFQFVKAQR
jgi:hypothetical protein